MQVRRTRTVKGPKTTEVVYAICSLDMVAAPPASVAAWLQGHWSIENALHWVRDVVFDEDRHQLRIGSGPQAMATLRNTAINLLRLAGHTRIASALRHHSRDANRPIDLITAARPRLCRVPAGGPREKIVFLVRDPRRETQSYTWRIWSGGTSFYVKPRHPPVAGFKVSLHGPRDGEDPEWKVAVDWRDRDAAYAAGGRALQQGDEYKEVFRGRQVAPGVRLAARIRNPWTAFHRGSPCGPGPHDVRPGDHGRGFHCVIKPPAQVTFADVDVFVSDRGPYWAA